MRIFMWPWSLLTPVIIVAATVFFMTLLYTSRKDGFQAGQLASYHPLFMSLAFLLMTPLGALAFVADLGPLNRRFPDKGKRRTIHGIFSLMSLFFALIGYLVMYTSNKATGVDHFDFKDKHPSRSAHIVIGYLALLGMALQSLSGLHMFVVVTRDGVMRWKCHKVLGPICWLLGLAAMFLAVWFESKIEGNKWKISTVLIAWVAITAVLGITMSHICCSRRDHVVSDLVLCCILRFSLLFLLVLSCNVPSSFRTLVSFSTIPLILPLILHLLPIFRRRLRKKCTRIRCRITYHSIW